MPKTLKRVGKNNKAVESGRKHVDCMCNRRKETKSLSVRGKNALGCRASVYLLGDHRRGRSPKLDLGTSWSKTGSVPQNFTAHTWNAWGNPKETLGFNTQKVN